MREIKFRVWDFERRRMFYDGFALDGSDCSRLQPIGKESPGPRNELMQFTGLHDKNGKEIYEGDIVLFGENPIHEGTSGKVIWHKTRTGFVYEFINGGYKGKCTDMADDWRTYEVIGNIYEHPDLLK